MRDGDAPIVWRLDRLDRSLADPIRLTHEPKARGVGFANVTEQFDTRFPSGRLVSHVFGSPAEFARNLIRGRTRAEKLQLARSTLYRIVGANP